MWTRDMWTRDMVDKRYVDDRYSKNRNNAKYVNVRYVERNNVENTIDEENMSFSWSIEGNVIDIYSQDDFSIRECTWVEWTIPKAFLLEKCC